MGPGGCQEPGRDLQVAEVSSAAILAEPGLPLTAAYWTTRLPGETWTAWRARQEAEELEAKAASHLATARRLQGQAADLRASLEGVSDE